MKSNYKPIGKYIREVKARNTDETVSNLLGVNINKYFMPSVANIVGTDMTKYKVVKKSQFACNRMHVGRDKRLPVALSTNEEDFLVSPAYDVFEVKDENILNPEYLMMWFSRKEFDRNAWFYTDADVRGGLHWKAFCEMKLPITSLEKQKEIVAEYNTIVNRIKLNEQLNQKLEETAQAIYNQWFVDFEFPISKEHAAEIGKPELKGKPYKSSGGKMVWNDELDQEIPEGWDVNAMGQIIPVKDGTHDSPKPTEKGFPLITSTHLKSYELSLGQTYNISSADFDQVNKRSKVDKYDILFSMIGTVGSICFVLYDEINFAIKNVGLFKTSKSVEFANYALFYLKSKYATRYIETCLLGSTQSYVTLTELRNIPVLFPPSYTIKDFNSHTNSIVEHIYFKVQENVLSYNLHDVLLQKMTKAEATV
jgi:type I restriction enzyme, S subunit